MKKIRLAGMLILLFAALSCSKKNTVNPPAETGNTVKINGKLYNTVTIGNQIWTTTNYTGPGGSEINSDVPDSATTGNFYSSAAVSLPVGWRVPSMYDYDKLLGNYSSNDDGNNNVICNLDLTEGLLAKTSWQGFTGSNTSGFNAYAAGYLNYLELNRKTYAVGAGTAACFLTSTNFQYADWTVGSLTVGNVVLEISTTAKNYNYYTYYTSLVSFQDDPLNGTSYASLRFVRDK